MQKTIRISEEENEDFCPINEREVVRWLEGRKGQLQRRGVICMIDTPTITEG